MKESIPCYSAVMAGMSELAMKNADHNRLAAMEWSEKLAAYGAVQPDSSVYQRESLNMRKIAMSKSIRGSQSMIWNARGAKK